MAHKHSVYDTDTHFIIDGPTHAIKNAAQVKNRIFQGAHNSERYTFELPKLIDGHDMTQCDSIKIHYINIDSATREQSVGVYEVTDAQVSPNDSDLIEFTWLHTRNVTKHAGSLTFLIHFACTAEDDTYDYEWPTEPFSGISVVSTFSNSETVVESFPDILEQWERTVMARMEQRISEAIAYDGSVTVE